MENNEIMNYTKVEEMVEVRPKKGGILKVVAGVAVAGVAVTAVLGGLSYLGVKAYKKHKNNGVTDDYSDTYVEETEFVEEISDNIEE